MLAGPEHARQLQFFEEKYLKLVIDDDELSEHHEDAESHPKRYHSHVCAFTKAVLTFDSPSDLVVPELITIDTHDCKDQSVIDSIRLLESKGKAKI